MPSGATGTAQTDLAEGKCQVVGDHQQVLRIKAFLVHPIAHRFATKVHERLRLDQHEGAPFVLEPRSIGIAARAEGGLERGGKGIQHLEADVVACAGIFRPGITEARNEVFHGSAVKLQAPHEAGLVD